MRKLIIVVGLLAFVAACGPGITGPATPTHPVTSKVQTPALVTPKTYPAQRELYDALPLGQPDRAEFRNSLLVFMVQQANTLLKQNKEDLGFQVFRDAVSLYDPREVYRERLNNPGLGALAARVVKRFSPRGDVLRVMLGLCVGLSLSQQQGPLEAEFRSMTNWVSEMEVLDRGSIAKGQRVGRIIEETAKAWPSPFVVDELKKNRLGRIKTLSREAKIHAEMEIQSSYPELYLSGMSIVRVYVRVNDLPEALRQLDALPSRGARYQTLRSLLGRVTSPTARVGDYLDLARYYKPWDATVALLVCRVTRKKFPKEAGGHACVGRMAHAGGKMLLAQQAMEQAVRLDPRTFTFVESLADIYRYRSMRLALGKRTGEAVELLRLTRKFFVSHPQANQRRAEAAAHFYFKMGDDSFDQGLIDLAAAALEVSLVVRKGPKAAVKLGIILANRDPARALELLDKIQKPALVTVPEASSRQFWLANFASLRGKALTRKGHKQRGRAAHTKAVVAWRAARGMDRSPQGVASAYLFEAKSLFALGSDAEALQAVAGALAVKPLRRGTYLDAIALLSSRSHLTEALAAYHRLMKHHGVNEYHLTYCSLWMVTMARRLGQTPDPVAMAFLRKLSSPKWYSQLARLVLGQVSYRKLLAEARSVGDRAELHFYWGELLRVQGKKDQARAMYRKVLETEMMGFYEYEMAIHYLRKK